MNESKINGLDLMAEYVFLSMYSQKKPDGNLESWGESVERIYDMHRYKLKDLGLYDTDIEKLIQKAVELEKAKIILSSQRSRQFASTNPNSGILKHEAKMYNCAATYIDRVEAFSEMMYLLLCGCGVGYSLHQKYIEKLPIVSDVITKTDVAITITDDIEGWANSIHTLVKNLYDGKDFDFEYGAIRPWGALIDGKFKAPGHEPLKLCHEKIREIFYHAVGRKLKSIEIHDIMCHIADSVISGGVRRSAMIALFDQNDDDMLKCKTGTWWQDNPQRAMANNSILTTEKDKLPYRDMKTAMQVIRQFGEPGIVNVKDYSWIVNPCAEIVMNPSYRGKTGYAFCNLVEINAERIVDEKTFYDACKIASFVATLQALYTNFKYLSTTSTKVAERDRNVGVSITGLYANSILLPEVLLQGSKIVAETNYKTAKTFGIAHSRTCTTIKPSGNASTILGLCCSGIHPAHDKQYLRRIRLKVNSPAYLALKDTPLIKPSKGNEAIISFPVEVIHDDVKIKDEVSAIDHLTFISSVKHYWINKGALNKGEINHNISATVEVEEDEWNEVTAVLYSQSYLFTGVALIPKLGDQIYDNAPFQRLSTPELQQEYDDIKNYIENNPIDFITIMSKKDEADVGSLTATACSGNNCEIK